MAYYYNLLKPKEFRHDIMSVAKECIIAHEKQDQIDKIREAKKEILKDLLVLFKRLESKTSILENMLSTDDLKKEILSHKKGKSKKLGVVESSLSKKVDEQVSFQTKESSEDMQKFDYTLDQIEKKLSELRNG